MKKIKSFTLIETLIVIVVFCIGILTVLYGLSQTLRNKEYANTQIQSAFFAREGIEMIFNLRDANYHKELPWNCIFEGMSELDENTGCENLLKPGKVLKINIGDNKSYINVEVSNNIIGDLSKDEYFDNVFEEYQIYKHVDENNFIYNHIQEGGEETGFARYILIDSVKGNDGKELDNDKLLKIESHVLYKKGIFKGEKVMETFIGNYEFNE